MSRQKLVELLDSILKKDQKTKNKEHCTLKEIVTFVRT
jgi:hypothetical protein